ncbi:MAG: NAD(P)/FAD-dependent oxidoreductase [Actinomycetota bacterium]
MASATLLQTGGDDSSSEGEAIDPDVEVLIVGAGVSGIGMACHLTRENPGTRYEIIEARASLGGTWDLFTYPGIRSDSDLYTFGFEFKPWKSNQSIAEGHLIKAYLQEAVDEYDVERHITFGQRVVGAEWDSPTSLWTVTIAHVGDDGAPTDDTFTRTCRWLQMCSGYYSYSEPYRPEFPGEADFAGRIEHPQFWPDDLQTEEQLANKRVVVIGSGATAITLIPALTKLGATVTMLQRTPTWIFPAPATNPIASVLRRILPEERAYAAVRKINAWRTEVAYTTSRTKPEKLKKFLNKAIDKHTGDDFPLERDPHFTPPYDPWDQRLCLSPDGDFFAAIKAGDATVVTDEIDTFDADGIVLRSGDRLDADIIVTATGLSLLALGGVSPVVDGEVVDIAKIFTYKGFMYSGVPNLGTVFGYINASWTLRADLVAKYVCRILQQMDAHRSTRVVPVAPESLPERPYITDFPAGYMQRKVHEFPKQSDRDPWTASQSYKHDKNVLLAADAEIDDGVLEFSTPVSANT